jgi:hypothetical protein
MGVSKRRSPVDNLYMKLAIISLVSALSISGAVSGQSKVRLGGEVELPVPTGWVLGSDSGQYPFQIVNEKRDAEFLLFRSILSPDQTISNEKDLQISVKKVVDNVIESLPQGKLLTNTGFFDVYRTGFVLEFVSADTAAMVLLRHRLEGILYRHPDGRQLLFTLWGKAALVRYPELARDIKSMQDGFEYTGPYESSVFAPPAHSYWYLYVVLLLIIGFVFYNRSRRARSQRDGSSAATNSWTCGCGRLNPGNMQSCLRCGQERVKTPVS